MLEVLARERLPRDLLRVIYAFYVEVYLQENLRICHRLFLEFLDLEGRFQTKLTTYEEDLMARFRALLGSNTVHSTHDEITHLNTLFRSIGGHRDRMYRQLVGQYKQYARVLQYYVNDTAYEICEQIWMSLYILNRTAFGRRSLTLDQVEQSRIILTKEVNLVYLGTQTLPRYQSSKERVLQYVMQRLNRYVHSWSFTMRRWLCRTPLIWNQLEQVLHDNSEALGRFLARDI